MPDKAIVNASPIIFLANAGLLDFLRSAAGEILLPVAVADEIRKGSETELAVIAIESSEWLRVVETPDVSPLVQTARKRGTIPAARPVLEKLRDNGMYLSNAVLERALMLVGE